MDQKIVYIGATFDCFHAGHIRLLERARRLGTYTIVALNRDEFVARFKRKPVMSLEERMAVVSNCRLVDECVINEGNEDTLSMLKKYRPDFVVFGSDYDFEKYKKQIGATDKDLEDLGIELRQFPYTQGVSTSDIIKRCKEL